MNKTLRNTSLMAGLLLLVFMTSSCARKNIVYLQDMHQGIMYPYDDNYEAVIHRDDRLSITVSCKNPELAIPFNMQGGNFKVASDGSVSADATSSRVNEKGYRVDAEGNIDFPILGLLHLEGLRVSEARDLIKRRITEGNYIKDPLVSIEFLNFKYTVLGAVGTNGVFNVDGDRITLLEAIARAGNVSTSGRINRVGVIRESNGVRRMYMHDLRSKDIFDSPCFYLQQNDIVYVEPKYRRKSREDRSWQVTTTILSVVSAVSSIIWATHR